MPLEEGKGKKWRRDEEEQESLERMGDQDSAVGKIWGRRRGTGTRNDDAKCEEEGEGYRSKEREMRRAEDEKAWWI